MLLLPALTNSLSPHRTQGTSSLPDGQHIAIVQPGAYDAVDGKISLVDNAGQNRLELLNFLAVSTASDLRLLPSTLLGNE